MQPLVPLVFHNLRSLYPPSFRRNDFYTCIPSTTVLGDLSSVFTTRSRADNTEVYIGSFLEREMADGWYGEWTDWRNDSEQQALKEPPKKRLRPYAFFAALRLAM